MLTNIYYYNLYRPYIVGSRDANAVTAKRALLTQKRDADGGRFFVLNKSRKDEIISYANQVSSGVTRFKSSLRDTVNDMDNLNRNSLTDGYDNALEWLADDLQDFADTYNEAAAFLGTQAFSHDLRAFTNEVKDNIFYNRDRLMLLGLSMDDDGVVHFDADYFTKLDQDQANVAIGENLQIFQDLYRQTTDLMTAPLADFMHIKTLSYHYNYKMGTMVEDGFGMIESGMIVDKVV